MCCTTIIPFFNYNDQVKREKKRAYTVHFLIFTTELKQIIPKVFFQSKVLYFHWCKSLIGNRPHDHKRQLVLDQKAVDLWKNQNVKEFLKYIILQWTHKIYGTSINKGKIMRTLQVESSNVMNSYWKSLPVYRLHVLYCVNILSMICNEYINSDWKIFSRQANCLENVADTWRRTR